MYLNTIIKTLRFEVAFFVKVEFAARCLEMSEIKICPPSHLETILEAITTA